MSASAAEPFQFLQLRLEGATAELTLARPPVNALHDAILEEIERALAELERASGLAVLRIRSSARIFSAGADLAMVATRLADAGGARRMADTARTFHRVYDRLAALPVVTLAEIAGDALGGGLELALACDLRVAAHEARLGLPEAKVGLLPGAGGTQRLTQLCGPGVAARIILSGDVVDGREAERIGLVQWSAARADVAEVADAIAARVARLSPDALRLSKICIRHAAVLTPEGRAVEIGGIEHLMQTAEARERVAAFLRR